MEPVVDNRVTIHDYFGYYRKLFFLTGYSDDGTISIVIRIIIYIINYALQTMSLLALWFVEEKENKVLSTHSYILAMYTWWALSTRIVTNKSVLKTRQIILHGIFRYEDEEEMEEVLLMKRDKVEDIRFKVKLVGTAMMGTAIFVVFVLLSQVFFMEEKTEEEKAKEIINPLLPGAYYIPVNTHTPHGFAIGMTVNLLNLISIYGMAACVFQVLYSCTSQLSTELDSLSHSLVNIERRARNIYLRSHPGADPEDPDLVPTKEFQDCLYSCLRSNAQHHLAILRFYDSMKDYCSGIVFITVIFVPALFACDLYLVLTNGVGTFKMAKYIFTFISELPYTFLVCYAGEEVIQAYIRYQKALYDISWYNYDKRFNTFLRIMMRYAANPLQLYAIIIHIPICLKTFGEFMSVMYRITNIWRQNEA